jgi:hypothetical protein
MNSLLLKTFTLTDVRPRNLETGKSVNNSIEGNAVCMMRMNLSETELKQYFDEDNITLIAGHVITTK